MHVLENRTKMSLVGELVCSICQEYGNVAESEALAGSIAQFIIVAYQLPDLVGNNFCLAPDVSAP